MDTKSDAAVIRLVYADCNASCPPTREALDSLVELEAETRSSGIPIGNPAAAHSSGERASRELERARESIELSCYAPKGSLVFTSGASESVCLALRLASTSEHGGRGSGLVVLGSAEHKSAAVAASDAGLRVAEALIPVDASGAYTVDGLLRTLDAAVSEASSRKRAKSVDGTQIALADVVPDAVIMAAAQNEYGTINNVANLCSAVRSWSKHRVESSSSPLSSYSIKARSVSHRAPVIVIDAAQAIGKSPVDISAWGADAVTWSAHKVGGPVGVGGLFVLPSAADAAWAHEQRPGSSKPIDAREFGLRSGTENVVGIAAAASAISAAVLLGAGVPSVKITSPPLPSSLLSSSSSSPANFKRHEKSGSPETERQCTLKARRSMGEWGAMMRGSRSIVMSVFSDRSLSGRVFVNGAIADPRATIETALCNTVSISVLGACGQEIARELETVHRVIVGTGSACGRGGGPSPALIALGATPEIASGTVRITTCRETTADQYALIALAVPAAIKSCLRRREENNPTLLECASACKRPQKTAASPRVERDQPK